MIPPSSLAARVGLEPTTLAGSASAFSEVSACSLPPKYFLGEIQAKHPGALPVRSSHFERALVYCSPSCRRARVSLEAKYLHPHCPEIGRRDRIRTCTSFHAHEFLRLACMHSTTRRKLVRTEGVAPSRTCVHRHLGPGRLLVPPHPQENWSRRKDWLAHRAWPYGLRLRRPGRAATLPHLRSPFGRRVYSALQLLLFASRPRGARSAHPSPCSGLSPSPCYALCLPRLEKKGLGRDSHPQPSPYEGAALTAAPPSRGGRRPRRSSPRERSGTPQVWAQPEFRVSETSQSHLAFLHVGQAWSLAHSATKLAAKAGLAPASRRLTNGRSAVELPGNGEQARIRAVISSVWERCLAVRRPAQTGARDRTRTD